jgi:EAL domain-containing protein (putative c-di-GMP-specific phosphodiesterase class I)
MRAIVHLSEGLHLKTIAEGVEDADQALHIKELGCQSAQGFLFSRPMPPDEIGTFLAASTRMAMLAPDEESASPRVGRGR